MKWGGEHTGWNHHLLIKGTRQAPDCLEFCCRLQSVPFSWLISPSALKIYLACLAVRNKGKIQLIWALKLTLKKSSSSRNWRMGVELRGERWRRAQVSLTSGIMSQALLYHLVQPLCGFQGHFQDHVPYLGQNLWSLSNTHIQVPREGVGLLVMSF